IFGSPAIYEVSFCK
ncbi:hypothetical protein MIMGU_mgv1a0007034mg, partial [Erythranthe guttata]